MKTGENWRKSDTNLSLWKPRLCSPAVRADGMRTAELGFLDYLIFMLNMSKCVRSLMTQFLLPLDIKSSDFQIKSRMKLTHYHSLCPIRRHQNTRRQWKCLEIFIIYLKNLLILFHWNGRATTIFCILGMTFRSSRAKGIFFTPFFGVITLVQQFICICTNSCI